MRLVRITLRNFRGVEDSTVHLSDGVTVVEGPNEAGKSSIAEALRHLREMKASSRHRHILRLQPVGRDVGPEAEVELTTGEYELTYRKRWLKSPLTELHVAAPTPRQYSGDEAHERFLAILDETVDLDLLVALDSLQGESLNQPELASVTALQRALDESSDGAPVHDELLERIETEYARYFTSREGKPTGEYKKVKAQLVELEEQLEHWRRRSDEMEGIGARHAATARLLEQLDERFANAVEALKGHEESARRLDELRRRRESAVRDLADARRELEIREEALETRASLSRDVASREKDVAERDTHLEMLVAEHEHTVKEFDTAARAESEAEAVLQRVREEAKRARARLDARRDRAERQRLADTIDRVREAAQRRRSAELELEASTIDDERLSRLADLSTDMKIATGARDAAAATVAVRALGEHDVAVDDATVPAGGETETVALRDVRVEVEGVILVEVRPGTPPAELARRVAEAEEAFEAELADAGVTSMAEARQRLEARKSAEARLESAESDLEHLLREDTLEAMERRLAELSARPGTRADSDGHSDDPAELAEAGERAEEAEREADDAFRRAREVTTSARAKKDVARDALTRAGESLGSAREELDALRGRLSRARELAGDDSLEQAVIEAREALATTEIEAGAAEAALQEADPETADSMLLNARELVDSVERDRDETRGDFHGLEARLDERAGEGIYDRLADAEAAYRAAVDLHDRLERAADAVGLLRDVVLRKRSEAQEKYVGPFKDRIERLGRIVFGRDFGVQISNDLAIERRTLDGHTVPFDSLSAGAKEQLALIGRLACAQLVDGAEGAPVILDDTLGFADPGRLERLNVVLGEVGRSAQVVLLTCQPSRFASLGGARVVRLPG